MATLVVDPGDHLLIDLSDQNHLHDFHGFLIGDPHSLNEL